MEKFAQLFCFGCHFWEDVRNEAYHAIGNFYGSEIFIVTGMRFWENKNRIDWSLRTILWRSIPTYLPTYRVELSPLAYNCIELLLLEERDLLYF